MIRTLYSTLFTPVAVVRLEKFIAADRVKATARNRRRRLIESLRNVPRN